LAYNANVADNRESFSIVCKISKNAIASTPTSLEGIRIVSGEAWRLLATNLGKRDKNDYRVLNAFFDNRWLRIHWIELNQVSDWLGAYSLQC
jgi:hypothetical protein